MYTCYVCIYVCMHVFMSLCLYVYPYLHVSTITSLRLCFCAVTLKFNNESLRRLLGPLGSQRKNIERETGFCLSLACCHYYGVIIYVHLLKMETF